MNHTPTTFAVVGEALVDLGGKGNVCTVRPGGSPANVATGLARLGHPATLYARLGDDPFGRLLHAHLTGAGVTLAVPPDPAYSTAVAIVNLDAGTASYGFRTAPGNLCPDVGPAMDATELHTGSLATALAPGNASIATLLAARRGEGLTVTFDPNCRPALTPDREKVRADVERFVGLSHVVKASEEDLEWLWPGRAAEQVAREWARRGPALVVLTRGGEGASCFWAGGGRADVAVPPVKVADTVGAGDSFMAGLLSGLLAAGLLGAVPPGGGESPRERLRAATQGPGTAPAVRAALERAARVAAVTCSRPGADPPTAAELAG